MKRDPTIHVKKSDLRTIVLEYHGGMMPDHVAKEFVDEVFRLARPYQIRHRSIVGGTTAQRTKTAKRANAACPLSPERMGRILNSERIRQNHMTITTIRKGDSAWTTLMELARDAYDFGELFDIMPRDEAYRQYVELGLQLIGRQYAINKFKYHKEAIFARKGAKVLIEKDPDEAATDRFEHLWGVQMQKRSRHVVKLEKLDRVHFIHARIESAEAGAKFKDWIVAQFERLSFLNALPNLNQFYGDGAQKRYREHMMKTSKKAEGEVVHALPTEATGDEETDVYYAMLNKLKQSGG